MRLSTWNYSRAGYYFVTICTKNKQPFFGRIKDGKMELNEIGLIAQLFWMDIPHHFDGVILDEFVIMPDHVHGIVVVNPVGVADLQPLQKKFKSPKNNPTKMILPKVIHGYKSSITRTIKRKNLHRHFKWQCSYYDHIIRNEEGLNRIRRYIKNNPQKWQLNRSLNV